MDFSKIKIPGFSIHTNEQKLAIIQKAITKKTGSRLKTLKISSPPVFDVSFANYNLSNSDYHKTPFVSSSQLKRLKKSEKHYLDASLMQYGTATKNSFAMGTLMHDDLENKIKTGEWMQWKAGTFKTKTTIKAEALEVHESVMPIIERYRKEFETDEILNKILMCADSEVSFFDHDDNEEEEQVKREPITNIRSKPDPDGFTLMLTDNNEVLEDDGERLVDPWLRLGVEETLVLSSRAHCSPEVCCLRTRAPHESVGS